MNFYIGITDNTWYYNLRKLKPDEVNFWQPSGQTFKVLQPGFPFLFKLRSPVNVIGGVGFFTKHTILPINLAWEAFGIKNGIGSLEFFREKILSLRSESEYSNNPLIGCIILTDPVFFEPEDWIPVPRNFAPSIQKGKTYSDSEPIGRKLWKRITILLEKYRFFDREESSKNQFELEKLLSSEYKEVMSKIRLGQGGFRILVTDTYNRRCSISGERTLPALEAAHIRPYSRSGPHHISNGLLLRADIHNLFDNGYITVTENLDVEVSRRIKEEFENGRDYYKYHGQKLSVLPKTEIYYPGKEYLQWHNEHIYIG